MRSLWTGIFAASIVALAFSACATSGGGAGDTCEGCAGGGDANAAQDGAGDGAGDGSKGSDGAGHDGAADAPADSPADAKKDASDSGGGNDSGPNDSGGGDSGNDAAAEASGGDAGDAGDAGDGGCGPLNTIQNCTACGAACDTIHSNGPSCNGTTCLYQSCMSCFADCDANTPPNLDGCETDISNVNNCAGCGNKCDTTTGTPSCNCVTCSYACNAGRADCNANVPPDLDGCETNTTNDVNNCSGCGKQCDTSTGTPTCSGSTCSYVCNSGRANCNTTPPNLGGCECATSACCGTSCQTTHSDGLGQSFYDCVSQGTYNVTQATEACTAFTGNQGQCSPASCKGGGSVVCSLTSPTSCACWEYSGTYKGHVHNSGVPSLCYCPGSVNDPKWN